jgi:hypothetical protein
MVLPSQVELDYTATPSSILRPADLATAMAAVSLPTGDLLNLGLALTSDVTSVVAGSAKRALIFSLVPPGTVLAAEPSLGGTVGYIVSSNPNDAPGGVGIRRVKYRRLDNLGNAKDNEFAALNGTTPVPLVEVKNSIPVGTIAIVEQGAGPLAGVLAVMHDTGQGVHQMQTLLSGDWQGSVQSTQAADKNVQVTITYHNTAGGGPFTETITLTATDGTVPKNAVNTNHGTIDPAGFNVSLAPGGGNLGIITLYAGLNGLGPPMAFIPPSYFAFVPFVSGQDFGAPLRGFFQQALAHALGISVTAAAPLFT